MCSSAFVLLVFSTTVKLCIAFLGAMSVSTTVEFFWIAFSQEAFVGEPAVPWRYQMVGLMLGSSYTRCAGIPGGDSCTFVEQHDCKQADWF